MSATPTAADRDRAILWLNHHGHRTMNQGIDEVLAASYAEVRAEAVAHERERAARVCLALHDNDNDACCVATWDEAAAACAAAIRAGESA